MRYRKLLEDAPITQIPQTFEQLCNAVALKPAERYGFDISGRQGSAIFISFTSWLCPSGGGTVNFDTDEVLINNPAPAKPIFAAFGLSLHAGLPEFVPCQKSAKQALDDVAADWQRAIGGVGG